MRRSTSPGTGARAPYTVVLWKNNEFAYNEGRGMLLTRGYYQARTHLGKVVVDGNSFQYTLV